MDTFSGSWSLPTDLGTPFLTGELTTRDETEPRPRPRPPPQPQPQPQQKDRKSERVALELDAGLRQRGGTGISVQIHDLSVDGFRASTHLDLGPGTDVWLRLPGLEPYQAKVAWAKGQYVGCSFERPLHPAVLEMLVGRTRGR